MATIIVSAQNVIEAAYRTISDIQAERAKRDAETVKRVMRLQLAFSWRRGFYRMDKEEARKWLGKQGGIGSWGYSQYAWGDLAHAKSLLKLAQHGDPVTLNEKDVEVLF